MVSESNSLGVTRHNISTNAPPAIADPKSPAAAAACWQINLQKKVNQAGEEWGKGANVLARDNGL